MHRDDNEHSVADIPNQVKLVVHQNILGASRHERIQRMTFAEDPQLLILIALHPALDHMKKVLGTKRANHRTRPLRNDVEVTSKRSILIVPSLGNLEIALPHALPNFR